MPSLTDPATHEPFYARTAHNDEIQGAAMADFAYNVLGVTTAAVPHAFVRAVTRRVRRAVTRPGRHPTTGTPLFDGPDSVREVLSTRSPHSAHGPQTLLVSHGPQLTRQSGLIPLSRTLPEQGNPQSQ